MAAPQPTAPGLPEACFAYHETGGVIVVLLRGENGYHLPISPPIGRPCQELADEMNAALGVSRAQAEAMLAGSMFGWSVPAADPGRFRKAVTQ